MRGSSPYAQNRATTLSGHPPLQSRPSIPEVQPPSQVPTPCSVADEQEFLNAEPETDLIDTAIVIKNIPFAYPEEDFTTELFPQLGLVPLTRSTTIAIKMIVRSMA